MLHLLKRLFSHKTLPSNGKPEKHTLFTLIPADDRTPATSFSKQYRILQEKCRGEYDDVVVHEHNPATYPHLHGDVLSLHKIIKLLPGKLAEKLATILPDTPSWKIN